MSLNGGNIAGLHVCYETNENKLNGIEIPVSFYTIISSKLVPIYIILKSSVEKNSVDVNRDIQIIFFFAT